MAKKASTGKDRHPKGRGSGKDAAPSGAARGRAVSSRQPPATGAVWPQPASSAAMPGAASLEALGVSSGDPVPRPLRHGRASPRGVLVVGLGDEDRGDGAVGLHLLHCLAQLDWPASVVFCEADDSLPARAEGFARIILLEAIEGTEQPGSLYQADPKELLANSVGGAGSGLGLLTMLSPAVLERVSIFGVQPLNTNWGSALSTDVIAAMPALMSYLRMQILKAASESQLAN